MVIDSSAVMAILLNEEDSDAYASAIQSASERQMPAVSALEISIAIGRRKGIAGLADAEEFLIRSGTRVVPFDAEHYRLAREAWWKYGKGRHPAGLNLGDCCSYVLAKASGDALLYKGADFGRTDVRGAM